MHAAIKNFMANQQLGKTAVNSVVSCDGTTERFQYLNTFLLDINMQNESI